LKNTAMKFSAKDRWLSRMTGIPINECGYWYVLANHHVRTSGLSSDPRNIIQTMMHFYVSFGRKAS